MNRVDSEMDSEMDRPVLSAGRERFVESSPEFPEYETDEMSSGALRDVTVLLVEDDSVTREALEVIFDYYGARVLSAESMGDALAHYEQGAPSIVVSDIGLRQGDGFMLLRAIRAREHGRGGHVPAIAVSGFPSRETGDRARQAGFDAFLRKPVAISTLLKMVCQLASRH